MNRSLIFAAFAAVGLLSVGCGSSSPPATTTTPAPVVTATPTDVPTATPTPDYRVTAAAAYLAAADTVNSGFDALNKAYPGTTFTSISQAKRYWSQAETLDRAFLTATFAITYPPFMKADVDAQIAAQTKVVADDTELAADPTDKAAQAADTTDSAAEAGTANVVRHDLSLPQGPLT
ncbi:MAG: hypothetical protein WB805_07230 [Candidatus Dormiibacterota bacterium]